MSSKDRIFRLNIKLLNIRQSLILLCYLLHMHWGIQFCSWREHWGLTWHLFIQCLLIYFIYLFIFLKERERKKKEEGKVGGMKDYYEPGCGLSFKKILPSRNLKLRGKTCVNKNFWKMISPIIIEFSAKGVQKWDYLFWLDNRGFTRRKDITNPFPFLLFLHLLPHLLSFVRHTFPYIVKIDDI